MIKTVSAERTIDAPAELIFARLAAVDRHPEWDNTAQRVEVISAGDAKGIGAEWKVYEHFGIMHTITNNDEDRSKQGTGLTKRTVTEIVPDERVAWTTHTMPNLGISATVTWTLHPEGRFTRASVEVSLSVPTVVERVGRVMFKSLDSRFEQQLNESVDQLQRVAEAEFAQQVVTV